MAYIIQHQNTRVCPVCACGSGVKDARRATATQSIFQFLQSAKWTLGNGKCLMDFSVFWKHFYMWSVDNKVYIKKTVVRSVLMDLCGVKENGMFPIDTVTT